MAIAADDLIEKFGTQDEVTTSSASVADAAFSIAGDTSIWTNDDDVPKAAATLAWTYGTAPDGGSVVKLFLRKMNVQSTNDDSIPTADNPFTFVGIFLNNDVTSAQRQTIDIALDNYKTSSEFEAYIQNDGGQTISSGWQLWLTPKTDGPKA